MTSIGNAKSFSGRIKSRETGISSKSRKGKRGPENCLDKVDQRERMRSRKRQCIKCSRDYWVTCEGWCSREDWWIRKGFLRMRTRIQGNLELEAHRIGKSEHAKICREVGMTYLREMAWIFTICVAIIFMTAAVFFSRTTFVTATARPKAPRGVHTAMERTTSSFLVPTIVRKDEGGGPALAFSHR